MKNVITDNRGVRYKVSEVSQNHPMVNPVSWELINNWGDGFYLIDDLHKGMEKQTLFKVENNEIIEAFRLNKLEKNKDML